MACAHPLESVFSPEKGTKPLSEQSEERGLAPFSGKKQTQGGCAQTIVLTYVSPYNQVIQAKYSSRDGGSMSKNVAVVFPYMHVSAFLNNALTT